MDPFHTESPGSFWAILYGILHDWAPYRPLFMASTFLLCLFPLLSKYKKNALVLLAVFIVPIAGLGLYCKLFKITHFITSRYFIGFLPLFLFSLYLSLEGIESKFERLRNFIRLKLFFVILFVASNLLILPPYYRSEKEDFRGLVNYLKNHLRQGDKLLDIDIAYTLGILHYFGVFPQGRLYTISSHKVSENESELRISFTYQTRKYIIYCSNSWGSSRSITLIGHSDQEFIWKESRLYDPIYQYRSDGRLGYRFAVPDLYLNPGDTAQIDDDEFTVDQVVYTVSAEGPTVMEVQE